MTENIEFIVLRKLPYRESSLIISGLSAVYGRLDFSVRGAKKVGSKSCAGIDLFREISIEFNPERDGLQTVYKAELLESCDNISNVPENYFAACEISRFILANTESMADCKNLYSALKNALKDLSAGKCAKFWQTLMKLVFLSENGLLPETFSTTEKNKKELLAKLLESAESGKNIPELTKEYWDKLESWSESLFIYHGLR